MKTSGESNSKKYIILSCGVLLIIACLCLGVILVSGVGVTFLWPFDFSQESTQISPTTPVNDLPEKDLPDQLANVLAEIESQVSEIRGLEKIEDVEHTLISAEDLEGIVVEDFFSEYSDQDAYQDVLVLSSLGLLPGEFDLKGFYQSLYSEQIAGFYDEETKEIFVVQGQDFGGSEKLTYSHEFTHVLQDQVYGLEEGLGLNEEACEQDSERCAAVQALIEGDASQTEILWFQTYASREDYLDLMDMFDQLDTPVFDSAPPFMSADLYFPYEKGFAFVQFLYEQGGFETVDDAYLNPPLSTEQILHPERYPEDIPLTVELPDLGPVLGDSWRLFDQNVMGEWYTYLILNKSYEDAYQITETQALEAAEGWGGDAYAVYFNESTDETIFIMDTYWDTQEDADQFILAFDQYASKRWDSVSDSIMDADLWQGDGATASFWYVDNRTLWVMAPDRELVELVLSEIQ
jgi:hypothetical protein